MSVEMNKCKTVVGFDKYLVSADGLVINKKTRRVLKPKLTYDGYYEVRLYAGKTNESSKFVRVHRIVANAFIPNPCNLETVDHINGDKLDNRAENLRWLSRHDNLKRFWDEQATEEQKIRLANRKPVKCLENGVVYESITQAAEKLGLNRASLTIALNNKSNKLRGFHFEVVKESVVC